MPTLSSASWRLLVRGGCVLGAGTVLFVLLGIAHEVTHRGGAFDLDAERTWPAGWSAMLLFLGVLAALWTYRERALGWPALAMAVLLSLAVVDEWVQIHEHIHEYTTAVAWQWFYAPLILLGAAAVYATIRRRDVPIEAKTLLLGGTGAWIAAQVVELVQWRTDSIRFDSPVLVVLEEALEMAGSMLIVLSLSAIALSARDRLAV